MVWFKPALLAFACVISIGSAAAADAGFSGDWSIDLRSPQERKKGVECGTAEFSLKQSGERISGEHSMSTPGCGRLNEGGPGTVKGIAVGSSAVLVVTSGRNGAMVLGKATKQGNKLSWTTIEPLQAGDPPSDGPLILESGVLSPDKAPQR